MKFVKQKYRFVSTYQRTRTALGRRPIVLKSDRPNVVMLLAADSRNIGDIAILEAQKKYLGRLFPSANQEVVYLSHTYDTLRNLRRHLGPDDTLLIQGGGFLGDLYPQGYFGLEWIARYFKHSRIVSFPQSLVTSDSDVRKSLLGERSHYIRDHEGLTLCAREEVSLGLMRDIYGDKVVYAPDIVLSAISLMRDVPAVARNGAVAAFRSDGEVSVSAESRALIRQALSSKRFNITHHDNLVSENRLNLVGPENLVRDTLDLYRRSQIVLTDRLHGMIFATITGTPCIVLPNNNHKIVASFTDWIKPEANYVRLIEESSIDKIAGLLEELTDPDFVTTYPYARFDFSELDGAILGDRH